MNCFFLIWLISDLNSLELSRKNVSLFLREKAKEVYKSERLIITQIAANSFVHVSYLQTNDFGNVPCNGLVVRNSNETIVFDTPTNDTSAAELIKWINDSLKCKIKAIVPTHFHDDCLGGLKAFHTNAIPSYANAKTIELATAKNYTVPQNSFTDSVVLNIGNEKAIVKALDESDKNGDFDAFFAAVLTAMARVYSPNISNKELLADFPVTYVGDSAVYHPEVINEWEKQFPFHMIDHYLPQLRSLTALKLDWGRNEDFSHIPFTSLQFSKKLEAYRIKHFAEEYIGDHGNMLGGFDGRIFNELLPFFEKYLK